MVWGPIAIKIEHSPEWFVASRRSSNRLRSPCPFASYLILAFSALLLIAPRNHCVAQAWVQTSAPITNWIALASSADGTKLAATAGYNVAGSLFTSTNSGETWTQRSVQDLLQSVASSADGTRLVATGSRGVWTSMDSAASWTVQKGPPDGLSVVACSADASKIAGISLSFLYTSTDFGTNWSSNSGSNFYFCRSIALSTNGTNLALFTQGSGFVFHYFFSTNSGNSWDERDGPFSSNNGGAIACSADGIRQMLAVSFVGIFTTTNFGVSWDQASVFGDTAWNSVACSADGSKGVAVSYTSAVDFIGMIYTSADSGASWVEANAPRTNWTAVASSADGNKVVAAVRGGGIYTWQASLPPRLNLALQDDNLVLSWTGSSTFTLQQNPDLSTTNWIDDAVQPVFINGQYQVVLQLGGSRTNFFRLKGR
jgi:hypothetical protein